ncbi:hypothetical protein [Micromonospora carbonacea]|uniref:Uncharacterized protein n=1 Tax=Micromonospora carbonacea TaxID=47853 RepID=A0A1C4WY48_9ACTN|nr:hypothetical protein [Micromonospora carbonacea]SCF01098.1 hypothetical protein GA0070563_104106 [Micromonospora carbonacea]
MTHQAPLIPRTDGPDIWRRFRLDGSHRINAAPWEDARARGEPVGTCRNPTAGKACGGYLKPGKPYRVDRIDWYPTTCGTCGNEAAARGPSPPRRRKR